MARTFGEEKIVGRRGSRRRPVTSIARAALLFAALGTGWQLAESSARAQGIYLPFVGPTNQSMGGAAAACPIDSIGALNWNPATISGLASSEVAFGLGLAMPTTSIDSSINANALGPGNPPINLAGTSSSEPGVCPVPTIGFVHRNVGSPWTLGVGIFGVGGFSANYPASTTNPISLPQPNGLGQLHAKVELYQVTPTISYAVTDRLSFGVAPVLNLANFNGQPFFLAAPNADGTYSDGFGTRTAFGGGFQLGTYYITDSDFRVGLSYKSPQWIEPFRFNSQDENGLPRFFKYNFDLPSITTLGFAYSGFERWLFAFDMRYFDYSNADGFSQQGFLPTGAVAGLGWKSIFSFTPAVQWNATDRLTLRAGYTFNQNPIGGDQAFFNVVSSLIIEHWLSFGATYRWNQRVSSTIAYTHGFENSVTGPLYSPLFGPLAGTSVTERVSADMLNAGITVQF
ncbi:MAG: hydrocarbon degradation protein [Pirellula sp.]|nr:hydrocarbon degradation protein [Pirellula sp.]